MSKLFNTNQQSQCSSCLVSYLLGLKYFSNKFRPNSGKCRVHGSIFKINKIHDSRAADLDPVCVRCPLLQDSRNLSSPVQSSFIISLYILIVKGQKSENHSVISDKSIKSGAPADIMESKNPTFPSLFRLNF